jgi:hypothetical protein
VPPASRSRCISEGPDPGEAWGRGQRLSQRPPGGLAADYARHRTATARPLFGVLKAFPRKFSGYFGPRGGERNFRRRETQPTGGLPGYLKGGVLTAPHAIPNRPRKREHAMGAAMPFSKFNVDPEHIEAMRAAFRRVCDVLQLDCGRDDPMTELIVMKIVERAKAGELDPERLCIDVLAQLRPPQPSAESEGTASRRPP